MNVLQIVSGKLWGRPGRRSLDMCRRLSEDDYSVAVITRGVEVVDEAFAAAAVPTAKLPLRGAFDLVTPISLAKVLNRMGAPIVVHVHDFTDAAMALRARRLMREPAKVRVVCTCHDIPPRHVRGLERICDGIDAIVFESEASRAAFEAAGVACGGSVHVVTPAVRVPVGHETVRPDGDTRLTLAWVGPITPGSGLGTLLKALARTGDAGLRVLVAGTGAGRDVMPLVRMSRSAELAGRVEWLGHVSDESAVAARADVGFAGPSLHGASVFLSHGVPVVAFATAELGELVSDSTDGMLVAPGDADALAAVLRRLAADTGLRRRLSEGAARTAASRFDYDDYYWKMLKIYAP